MQIINGRKRSNGPETLNNILKIQERLEQDQDFAQAVRGVRALIDDVPNAQFKRRLEELENDYQLMRDFMLKGYKDDQRSTLYKRLVRNLSTLLSNMETDVKRTDNSHFASLVNAMRSVDLDCTSIQQHLVKYVQDVAMLSLDDDKRRETHSNELYDSHFFYMRNLFNTIVLSEQWSEERAQELVKLLVSPTIDVADAQTLVSAVTLATLNTPDPQKVIALIQTYATAEEELVRQRALVGWVFAMGQNSYKLFPEVEEWIGKLLDDDAVRKEILQLLKQVVLCKNATQDQETLQKDILPTIMKNQEFEMTRYGIKEKEEDPIEEILHPDADEKKVELLEQSFQRISDMQKSGADIYFGGFSQMKRFSFFYTLSNWFTPFYMEHPQLRHLSSQMRESNFIRRLMGQGPFCDSDKYSFVLALSSVFSNLPDNIRGMMERGELQAGMPEGEGPTHTRVFVRRSYLQDLFRFFKLCDERNKFANPFDERSNEALLGMPIFKKMLAEVRNLEKFLLKQKKYKELDDFLNMHYDQDNLDDLHMRALVASHFKHFETAENAYRRMIEKAPNDEQGLRGLAQACFHQGKFADAEQQYTNLLHFHPDNRSYALYLAISQINNGQAEVATKLLFKLNYDAPDDLNVKRALAWAQLWMKNLSQAEKLYVDILQDENHVMADSLNAGYCFFFEGEVERAVQLMAEGLDIKLKQKGQEDCVAEQFKLDKSLFDYNGIPEADRKILADLVNQFAKSRDNDTKAS